MEQPKIKKRIHKTAKKKERYARLTRLRLGKNKPVSNLAQINDIPRTMPPKETFKVHTFDTGTMIGEYNGKCFFDGCMLNKDYISSCVTVPKGEERILCLQLRRNLAGQEKTDEEVIQEWESRNDPYWSDWANRIKRYKITVKEFLEKNRDKLLTDKSDPASVERYNKFKALRDECMAKKACCEGASVLSLDGYNFSELKYNSKMLAKLNYDFDEFRDMLLREGMPRTRYTNEKDDELYHQVMDNFENIFNMTIESPPQVDFYITKDNKLKKMALTHYMTGYFHKKQAKLAYFVTLEEVDNMSIQSSLPSNIQIKEESTEVASEMSLEKFYMIDSIKTEQH